MQTVIYARFSSQLQDSRSIDDQVRVCRERAAAEGWTVAEVYTDYAVSGAVRDRPGLNAMLARVDAGGVDRVLSESLDRISRSQVDTPQIFERLRFAGVQLFTLSEGEINELHIGLKGTMAALFRKDLAEKIRRGKKGRIAGHRIPGGLAYGYRKVVQLRGDGEPERGLREVDPEQADVIRRVFKLYLAGRSSRAIAELLNRERVPSPSGGPWRASSIQGDRIRKNGVLQNELYIGRLIYNRTRRTYDPETRRRVIRTNPVEDWTIVDAPEFRIVDQATWDAAEERRSLYDGAKVHQCRRPKRLLSGLGVCGVCGGMWTVLGTERWGCTRHRDGRGCTNNRTVSTRIYEQRVLGGLRSRLLDPDLVSAFVRAYHEERKQRTAEDARLRTRLERKLADTNAKLNRLVAAIADGAGEFIEMRQALARVRGERDGLVTELAEHAADTVVALHPAIAERYREQVARLTDALAADPEAAGEAGLAIRSLIDRIVLTPAHDGKGVAIEVIGQLASIIGLAIGQPAKAELERGRMLMSVPLA